MTPTVVRELPAAWRLPDMPHFAGLYIGGCVSAHGFGDTFAHSHVRRKGLEPWGWVCFRFPGYITDATGEPSWILKHELAHIMTDEEHTVAWGAALEAMGGFVHEYYRHTPYFNTDPRINGRKSLLGIIKSIGK